MKSDEYLSFRSAAGFPILIGAQRNLLFSIRLID